MNRINFYLARNWLCFIMLLWVQCKAMYPLYYYSKPSVMTVMTVVRKDKRIPASHHVTAITFLMIGIITTCTLSVFTPVSNQNHTAIAQQQQQPTLEGISF